MFVTLVLTEIMLYIVLAHHIIAMATLRLISHRHLKGEEEIGIIAVLLQIF